MALWDVLFVAEDLDFSSDQAVYYASAAVDVGSFHDEGILDLGVVDGGVVADAGVGADVGVGANFAVFADDGVTSDGCSAVDDGVAAYGDIVRYCYGFSMVPWL